MIFSSDAKNIYKLTNLDLFKLKYNYVPNTYGMYCTKYFLDEVEDYAIKKLTTDQINDRDTKKVEKLNKLLKLKRERNEYIERFIEIREELFVLINKTFPGINVNVKHNELKKNVIIEKIFDLISREALSKYEEDIFTCVCRIYELLRHDLNKEWDKLQRLELVNTLLTETFGHKSEFFKTEPMYFELINIDLHNSQYINYFFQNEKNIIDLQKIIDVNERKNKVTNYINTKIKKQYQSNLLTSRHINDYIMNGLNDWESVKAILDNLASINERKKTIERYINSMIKKFNEVDYFDKSFNCANVYNDELVSKYIQEGGIEITQIKKCIKKMLYEFLKKKLIYNYLESKKFEGKEHLVLENEIIIQFLDESCDLNSPILPNIIKQVIDDMITIYENEIVSITETFIGNINFKSDRKKNILMIIETLKIINENFDKNNIKKIYGNIQVKIFLNSGKQNNENWKTINALIHKILKE